MKLEKLIKEKEYIYLVYLEEHYKIKKIKNILINYIDDIKSNLKDSNNLKLYKYENLNKNELKHLLNINVFPVLIIKEKNKDIEYITGIPKI